MKYKDTKPIPRKVAIKNYLLNKRPYKAPQEQNDRVRQILVEKKPKIREISIWLRNGWKKQTDEDKNKISVSSYKKNSNTKFYSIQQNSRINGAYILPNNSIEENYDQKFDSLERIDSGRSSKNRSDCCRVC